MRNDEIEAARRYHAATSHSEQSLRRDRHFLDWENQPIAFKLYRAGESVPLANEWRTRELPARKALERIAALANSVAPRRPDLGELSELLFLAAGITKVKRHGGGETLHLRAYPNTGALHHVDLYVVCRELEGLPAGVYHFGPHDFALRRLRAGDWRAALVEASGAEPALARAPLIVASASTYWRNAWKYQARAYRHCFWDGGTLQANLLAAAAAAALPARLVLGFADGAVERLLGLDPEREGAIALTALGRDDLPPPAAPPPPELQLATEPLSAREVDYPEIRTLHAASSLRDGAAAARWRGGLRARALPSARGTLFPLDPPGKSQQESLESVIRRRGSTREFDPEASLTRAELASALDLATRGLAADFIDRAGSSLIDPYLIVHAVEGLPAGSYFYRREEHALELLREGDFRQLAGRLGLFQELPADASVNLYCLTPLGAVVARFGNRGYRAAQLEGGIVGGRAYLAAYAQGFGASGLTFLDDEVTEFFSPHAAGKAVMFLVALGRSAWRRR